MGTKETFKSGGCTHLPPFPFHLFTRHRTNNKYSDPMSRLVNLVVLWRGKERSKLWTGSRQIGQFKLRFVFSSCCFFKYNEQVGLSPDQRFLRYGIIVLCEKRKREQTHVLDEKSIPASKIQASWAVCDSVPHSCSTLFPARFRAPMSAAGYQELFECKGLLLLVPHNAAHAHAPIYFSKSNVLYLKLEFVCI